MPARCQLPYFHTSSSLLSILMCYLKPPSPFPIRMWMHEAGILWPSYARHCYKVLGIHNYEIIGLLMKWPVTCPPTCLHNHHHHHHRHYYNNHHHHVTCWERSLEALMRQSSCFEGDPTKNWWSTDVWSNRIFTRSEAGISCTVLLPAIGNYLKLPEDLLSLRENVLLLGKQVLVWWPNDYALPNSTLGQ